MAARGPWSVKGIDAKAREAALQAARSEGVTLGDYLNRLLLETEGEDTGMAALEQNQTSNDDAAPTSRDALDKLTRRIEAVEARSTLAITGIDQSVVGLLSRLENDENSRAALEGRLDLASDELRQTQKLLEKRIERMESDDSDEQNLRALKSLENALERLAGRVEQQREEATRLQSEVSQTGSRMDRLNSDVDQKLADLTQRVDTTLSTAAASIEKAVEQAELRTEGANRHLADRMSQLEADLFEEKRAHEDRFSGIESSVNGTLSRVTNQIDRLGERMSTTESQAEAAAEQASSQGDAVTDFAERLTRAESTTDTALRELESHFNRLDDRLDQFDADLDGGSIRELRSELDDRLKSVAGELAQTIMGIREDLASQIETATNSPNEAFAEINSAVAEMHKRMKQAEKRQNDAIEAIGEEFARLTTALDKRVRGIESRNDSDLTSTVRDQIDNLANSFSKRIEELETRDGSEGLNTVSKRMNELAEALDKRVNASEERSAQAIRDFTEHVSTLTRNFSAKQEKGLEKISGEIQESEKRQSQKLDTAMSGITERISQVEEATASAVSPIQKAMASLAERLSAVEDFSNPPGVSRPQTDDLSFASFEDTLNKVSDKPETKTKPAESAPTSIEEDFWDDEPVKPKTAARHPIGLPDIPDIPEDDEAEHFSDNNSEQAPDPWADEHGAFDDADNGFGTHDDFGFDDPAEPDDNEADLDAAEADSDPLDDPFGPSSTPAAPDDYLARARAAANAGAEQNRSNLHSPRAGKTSGGGRSGSSKIPLVAAVSVIALGAAGTAGYMMMRGKQNPGIDSYIATPSETFTPQASDTPTETAEGTTLSVEDPWVAEDGLTEDLAEDETASETAEIAAPEADEPTPANVQPARAETRESKPERAPAESAVEPPSSKPAPAEAAPEPAPASPPVAEPVATTPPAPAQPATPAISETPTTIQQYQDGMTAINEGRIAEGATLIKAAAEAGEPIAQYRLSKLYERGQGVPRDLNMSRQWTEEAAKAGNVKAMHDLAVFFAEGDGGQQSYAGAVQWFRKAADHGLIDSQYNLGVLYEQGLGVTANPSEALYWFRVADKLGDSAAAAKVAELSATLSPGEVDRTARLAADYKVQPGDPVANGRFPQPSPQATSAPTPLGAKAQILEAQILLNALGYNAGAPDGDFGSRTRQAILDFQSANRLPQSGEVTPTLLRQLQAASQ